MKREEITLVAQLLSSMKDAVDKLEEAYKKEDMEKLSAAKKEITEFQKKISKLL